jgi:hypothetical protein
MSVLLIGVGHLADCIRNVGLARAASIGQRPYPIGPAYLISVRAPLDCTALDRPNNPE